MGVAVEGTGAVSSCAREVLERLPSQPGPREVVVDARSLVGPTTTTVGVVSDGSRAGTRHERGSTGARIDETPGADPVVIAPRLGPSSDARADVVDGGWFGGIGTLVAAAALARSDDPQAVHVGYGLPGARRAWRAAGPALRREIVATALRDGEARVAGHAVPEPLAVGRRLAWFPRPVGPAHSVAVPGHEVAALTGVATVRTWLATGSLRAELLQALGRLSRSGAAAGMLHRRAARPVRTSSTTLRWAVVAEVRDGGDGRGGQDGGVVRAWANGTDPVRATGALLAVAALAASTAPPDGSRPGSVRDVAGTDVLLDQLADLGVLRWSVARPEPSSR